MVQWYFPPLVFPEWAHLLLITVVKIFMLQALEFKLHRKTLIGFCHWPLKLYNTKNDKHKKVYFRRKWMKWRKNRKLEQLLWFNKRKRGKRRNDKWMVEWGNKKTNIKIVSGERKRMKEVPKCRQKREK